MRIRTAVAIVVAMFLLAATAPANARLSRATYFKAGGIQCGVFYKEIGGMACFSPSVPTPFGTDGYISLHRHHRAALGERGDCAFRNGCQNRERLDRGDRWRRVGVTCAVKQAGVRCHNQDGHGFKISFSSYRLF